MPRSVRHLLSLARQTLILNQQGLANVTGSSLRTVQRWNSGTSSPADFHLHKLADAVRTRDAQLAAEIDLWAPRGTPPQLVASAPLAPSPSIPTHILVDSVVCAAADAMGQRPEVMRPALLAAFTRAKEAQLSHDAIVQVLAGPMGEGVRPV